MRRPRVYRQGTSTYVIGTDDIQEALKLVGISPRTHRWGSTSYGFYVRRQGKWRMAGDYQRPKDAKPGICFVGTIRPVDTAAAS